MKIDLLVMGTHKLAEAPPTAYVYMVLQRGACILRTEGFRRCCGQRNKWGEVTHGAKLRSLPRGLRQTILHIFWYPNLMLQLMWLPAITYQDVEIGPYSHSVPDRFWSDYHDDCFLDGDRVSRGVYWFNNTGTE